MLTHAPVPFEGLCLLPRRPLPLHVARREPRLRPRPHEREQFVRLLREYERFCGVRVLTNRSPVSGCSCGVHFRRIVGSSQANLSFGIVLENGLYPANGGPCHQLGIQMRSPHRGWRRICCRRHCSMGNRGFGVGREERREFGLVNRSR